MVKIATIKRAEQLKKQAVRISCVVPVHNEEANIQRFINELQACLQPLAHHFEIIVVDDGSTDTTTKVMQALLSEIPQLKFISFSRNFGKENALSAGLKHATGDVIMLIDADFQHPIAMIPTLLHRWAEGYEMVYGVRQGRENETYLKRLFASNFYRLMHCLTRTKIPANAGDFRLLDRCVVDAINSLDERDRFMKGLYAWVGFKSLGVPFRVEARSAGSSSLQFGKLTELALTGITAFSDVPLRIWGIIGLAISSVAFLYGLYVIFNTLIMGVDVPGYATLIVAIMFFGGIQLLSIGILGEYIARIFHEVKKRPKYIIAETHGFNEPTGMTD